MSASLAQCWRQAGNFAEADRCEERAIRLAELRDQHQRAERLAPIRAKHNARRAEIARIREERKEARKPYGQAWMVWYHTHDCVTCSGTGHSFNADSQPIAPCPNCKYGRTVKEPMPQDFGL